MENNGSTMKTAFGLDIAGYSTGKSGFVRACRKSDNSIIVMVYRGHIFSKKYSTKDSLGDVVNMERELLLACCRRSSVMVDIPIDLQGLPHSGNSSFVWQLTMRPVDYAFGGMAPLANYIGAPVARFQNMITASTDLNTAESLVGKQIFETYPAASLRFLDLPYEKYKKHKILFHNGCWTGGVAAEIAEGLGLVAENGDTLNSDELDAIICAITGVVNDNLILQGDELEYEILKKVKNKLKNVNLTDIDVSPPRGYVLLKEKPNVKIILEMKTVGNHDNMMKEAFCDSKPFQYNLDQKHA